MSAGAIARVGLLRLTESSLQLVPYVTGQVLRLSGAELVGLSGVLRNSLTAIKNQYLIPSLATIFSAIKGDPVQVTSHAPDQCVVLSQNIAPRLQIEQESNCNRADSDGELNYFSRWRRDFESIFHDFTS